jgi:signal transduction histidine kinase
MSIYSIPVFLGAVFSFLAGCYILRANYKSQKNISFSIFCFSLFVWLFGYVVAYSAKNQSLGLLACRIACTGAMFTAPAFYHFAVLYTEKKVERKYVLFAYLTMLSIVPFSMSSRLFLQGVYEYYWGYYSRAGLLHPIYLVIFFGIFLRGFYILYIRRKHVNAPLQRTQMNYIFVAYFIALLGAIDYIPKYGVEIFPFGFLFEIIFIIIVAYAIVKYHLLDINIALTRVGMFIAVYAIVLGVPFWFGLKFLGRGLWLVPTGICAALATAGSFIYLFLQKKIEMRMLQEEHRMYELLLQASYGMNTIHDLNQLLDMIVEVVKGILRVDKVEVYLLNKERNNYYLAAPKKENNNKTFVRGDDALVETLKRTRFPVVYEKIKMMDEESTKSDFMKMALLLEKISSSVVIPIIIDNSMLGFLSLGDRKSKEMFSKELLNTLTVLGNQAALAIENCHYLELESQRMQEEGLRERMESLDNMASSMAHEIDNPMHGVLTSLAFIKDFVMKDPRFSVPEPLKNDLEDGIHRIENCSERVSNMIKAILDYSRLGTGQLLPVKIQDAVDGFRELVRSRLKKENVSFQLEVEDDLPLVLGDKIQLEEILVNFVRNSLHAVKLEEEKKIALRIFKRDAGTIRIECADNGYGIEKEILSDIFLSSMTTKGSSEGTGLGLYRVRKIVDLFNGRVWAESEGKGRGATFIVELPALEGNMEELLKENMNDTD